MTVEAFIAEHAADWDELNSLLREAGTHPERLPPATFARLGALYRAASADLGTARRQYRFEALVPSLEELVGRARVVVYGRNARRGTAGAFLARGYWQRVMERPRLLVLAALLLFVPAGLATAWGASSPGEAAVLAPGSTEAIGEPREGGSLGLRPDENARMSSEIMTNNIQVAIMAFAGGMTAGALTVLVLLFNGGMLGAFLGIALSAGNGAVFTELIVPHGVLELSCIVVAGAAGLRLGAAIINPGRRSRGLALRQEGRAAAEMVLGTAFWLIVAGLVEGFYTPSGGGVAAAVVVGGGLGVLYWALAWRLGRAPTANLTPAPAP